MGRIRSLRVSGYKSVNHSVELRFPSSGPLVLVGENNAGKSNLITAIELLLGESWPGNYDPEDHHFYGRDKDGQITIEIELEDVWHQDRYKGPMQVDSLAIQYPADDQKPFHMTLEDGTSSPYVSNNVRGQCLCTVIAADRRLSHQLSYSSKYTLLSRMMRQFHRALVEDSDRISLLKSKFHEIKSVFEEVQAFSEFSGELQSQMEELSGNLDYKLDIDFSAYDPSNFFHALRVQPQQDGLTRTFEELGTGQEQILALAFAYAYMKAFRSVGGGLVLVIEEPEAHLHPLAQEWLSQKIKEMTSAGVQVVITTHSPSFIDVDNLEGLALIRKDDGASKAVQLTRRELTAYCKEHGAAIDNEESILPFYSAAATDEIMAGFFARKVVLVEGPTEAMSVPTYLAKAGMSTSKEGIAVISAHGVGNLAKWWRLFTAFGIPTFVMFDNDSRDDQKGQKRQDLLAALSIPDHRHNEIMTTDSWLIEDSFAVFGGNYEEALRSLFADSYVRLEEEAKAEYGLADSTAKPLVARYVAEHLNFGDDENAWKGWLLLKDKLLALSI